MTAEDGLPPLDQAAKKEALRLFTYGLYAVTTGRLDGTGSGDGPARWNAFTANWVSQVSFEPPLVVVSVENASSSLAMMREAGHFAVNVFDAGQRELAGRLGKPLQRSPEKLDGLQVAAGSTGCPVLLECSAWVECVIESELATGDSTLVVGRVVGAQVMRKAEPLTMLAAGFKHAG